MIRSLYRPPLVSCQSRWLSNAPGSLPCVAVEPPGRGELFFEFEVYSRRRFRVYSKPPGGSVTAGTAICATIHQFVLDGAAIGYGLAASMGAFLLSAGVKEILCLKERLNTLLAAQTGQPPAKIAEDTNRDYFLSAQESCNDGPIAAVPNTSQTGSDVR
ncbi:MAG: hypothetical protein TE42_07695 [Candidatus Synechococcus spongiarum SP3]|uniref:ATP-dependent Clp protease proteolytic subunit n=1 Tax=Candidatus Synechococcus spongiarum SP3 TaxID=1604020 RepID=A0A0G2HK17_9SYNE|nr:MAG: hypothetical protein TE42_07695 [Candidatus Synechococcus spongiarum SP3]